MSVLDISILGAVVLAAILGYRDGFIRKIFGLLGFFIGLFAAARLTPGLGKLISEWMGASLAISYVLAFSVVFLCIVILEIVIYKIVGKGKRELQILNRLSGSFLGLAQGTLAVSVTLLMLNLLEWPSEETRRNSLLYKSFLNVAPRVVDLTMELFPRSRTFYDRLRENLEKYEGEVFH